MNKLQQALEFDLADDEQVTLADGYEDAFIGIGRQFGKPVAVYDRDKCISILCKDMSPDDAEEYFQFNTEGAWVGESTPIFVKTP